MFSLKNENKTIKYTMFFTCSVFFLVCVFISIKYNNALLLGSLNHPDNDDVKFIRSAWILKTTGVYVYHNPPKPTVFMMPGLPYSLAAVMSLFGKLGGITAYRIIQAFIQTLSLIMTFFIGRKLFNSKVGIIALVISAFYIPNIWTSTLILTETFFSFFVLLLVYFSIYALEEKKLKFYILAAIAWGFAALFRPTIATYPIIILVLWIMKKYKLKDMIKYGCIVAVIFCLILSPWWIRNYKIFNRFIPLTMATGNPTLQGTYLLYDQSTKKTDGLNYSQFKYPKDDEIKNNEIDMKIVSYRLKNLVPKHPIEYFLWYTLGKGFCQVGWPFYWLEQPVIILVLSGMYHYVILITAVLGMMLHYKNKKRLKINNILLGCIIYFIAVYLPFYAFPRYFYPAMPYVIIFSSVYLSKKIKFLDVN